MFDEMPSADRVVLQEFVRNDQRIGGVTVFRFSDMAQRNEAYAFVSAGRGRDMQERDDFGERAVATLIDATILAIRLRLADVAFVRCTALAHIRMGNEDPEAALAYAQRLDVRLREAVC